MNAIQSNGNTNSNNNNNINSSNNINSIGMATGGAPLKQEEDVCLRANPPSPYASAAAANAAKRIRGASMMQQQQQQQQLQQSSVMGGGGGDARGGGGGVLMRKSYKDSSSDEEEDIPLKKRIKKEKTDDDDDDYDAFSVSKRRASSSATAPHIKSSPHKIAAASSSTSSIIKSEAASPSKNGNSASPIKRQLAPGAQQQQQQQQQNNAAGGSSSSQSRLSQSQSPSKKSPSKKAAAEAAPVWKWWEEEKPKDGAKWRFLEHKGPFFAPEYERVPESVQFLYAGRPMLLSSEAEEVATFYARMLDHEYTTKERFNENFFRDWREVMTAEERRRITDLSQCDFSQMHAHFLAQAELRKQRTKEEKAELKAANAKLTEEYGFCMLDGYKQKIGNFKIEPPGLFRGRGTHPKMGQLKRRVQPEEVIINCSRDSAIPEPPAGHHWKEVRHDPNVTWLACWVENVQNNFKYVMLNASSRLKGEKDWQKYETARRLHLQIDRIRGDYVRDFKSNEMKVRQRAVALYFIDKLALRAGNEKDEDEADTVGCCSLRYEHIKLHERILDAPPPGAAGEVASSSSATAAAAGNAQGEGGGDSDEDDEEEGGATTSNKKKSQSQRKNTIYEVEFDFLGKDSIRYQNTVPVVKRVFKNLKIFMRNKRAGDDLFDRLNTKILNEYLRDLMPGLSAKVFRTYNASKTLEDQLRLATTPDDNVADKILSYNRANRTVAILCNHQRAVPKTHEKSMEKLQEKIKEKRDAIADIRSEAKQIKADFHARKDAAKKEKYDKLRKKLKTTEEQLHKLEVQSLDREENKEIAMGTSKLNYLDPRISVSWCKRFGVPLEKIYNKTQREKFQWAIDMASERFVFCDMESDKAENHLGNGAGGEDDEEEDSEAE